jgi:Ca-activated chloride channel family protein
MFRSSGLMLVLAAVCAALLACSRTPSRTPEPPAASPIAIEAKLANKYVQAGGSRGLVARVSLSARRRSATARPPVNLALLVDTSGSMEGRAIEDARAASLALLAALAPEDRLAVVVFHSKADVLLPSTRVGDADAKDLRAKIAAMRASGTTDMADGLRIALDEVERHLDGEGVNRVVLLGDGVPNDDTQVLTYVAQAASRGVSITALGLGGDYDETLMGKIAQTSGGRFHYVEDSTKVQSFFAEEVVRLHKVVARSAYVELRPGPGVVVRGVVGHPASPSGRSLVVNLGDVSLGDEQELVVDMTATNPKDGANVEVLDAVLHFQDGVGGAAREERVFVGARATKEEAKLGEGRDRSVEQAAARARDAAATLERIQQQRESDRGAKQGALRPAVPTPAHASPQAPAAPAPAAPPERTRYEHDEAMRVLGY